MTLGSCPGTHWESLQPDSEEALVLQFRLRRVVSEVRMQQLCLLSNHPLPPSSRPRLLRSASSHTKRRPSLLRCSLSMTARSLDSRQCWSRNRQQALGNQSPRLLVRLCSDARLGRAFSTELTSKSWPHSILSRRAFSWVRVETVFPSRVHPLPSRSLAATTQVRRTDEGYSSQMRTTACALQCQSHVTAN